MELSGEKSATFEHILGQIESRKKAERPFAVGITGVDCAGKSHFTLELDEYLRSKGLQTQIIFIDDFLRSQEERYSGRDEIDNYFNMAFATQLVIDKLLKPIQAGVPFSETLTLLDFYRDVYDRERHYSFTEKTIVLFDGVFLFRKELAPYSDYKIFLEISFDECKRRAVIRGGEESLVQYERKYIPGQQHYLGLYPPEETAELIIDNSDYNKPRILKSGQDIP